MHSPMSCPETERQPCPKIKRLVGIEASRLEIRLHILLGGWLRTAGHMQLLGAKKHLWLEVAPVHVKGEQRGDCQHL